MASKRRGRPTTYLLAIKQRKDESLKAYLAQFNKECMTTDHQDKKIKLAAVMRGLWPKNRFMAELVRRTPTKLWEFMIGLAISLMLKTLSRL